MDLCEVLPYCLCCFWICLSSAFCAMLVTCSFLNVPDLPLEVYITCCPIAGLGRVIYISYCKVSMNILVYDLLWTQMSVSLN
jgi:hypothetical protein